MKEIIYYYGYVYIFRLLFLIFNRIKKKGFSDGDIDATIISDAFDGKLADVNTSVATINKIKIDPDFIWALTNVIWMLIGCIYLDEKIYFIVLLLLFNIISPLLMVKNNTHNKFIGFLIRIIAELIITSLILYSHFLRH